MGDKRTHPRQHKRDRSLLNTPQASGRQDSKGETGLLSSFQRAQSISTTWWSVGKKLLHIFCLFQLEICNDFLLLSFC